MLFNNVKLIPHTPYIPEDQFSPFLWKVSHAVLCGSVLLRPYRLLHTGDEYRMKTY